MNTVASYNAFARMATSLEIMGYKDHDAVITPADAGRDAFTSMVYDLHEMGQLAHEIASYELYNSQECEFDRV